MFGNETAEQAREMIEVARKNLIDAAAEGSYNELSRKVNEVAHWEGIHMVLSRDEMVVSKGFDKSVRIKAITDLLVSGSDDAWSGRGNDARRSYFDGVCEASRELLIRLSNDN